MTIKKDDCVENTCVEPAGQEYWRAVKYVGMIQCDDQIDQEAPTLRSADLLPKTLTPPQTFQPMPLPQNKPTVREMKLNLNDYDCRCGRKCNSTEKKCWYCTDPIEVKKP